MPGPFAILDNARHPHEDFRAARELEAQIETRIQGEVRFDAGSRALYATDASNYRQVPIGVVVPRDIADVEATFAACRELGAPILARGGERAFPGNAAMSRWCWISRSTCGRFCRLIRSRGWRWSSRGLCSTGCGKRRRSIT